MACMSPLSGTKVLQTRFDLEESCPWGEAMWTDKGGKKGHPGQVGGWCVGECLGSMPWGTARLGPVELLMRTAKK